MDAIVGIQPAQALAATAADRLGEGAMFRASAPLAWSIDEKVV